MRNSLVQVVQLLVYVMFVFAHALISFVNVNSPPLFAIFCDKSCENKERAVFDSDSPAILITGDILTNATKPSSRVLWCLLNSIIGWAKCLLDA